MVDGFNRMVWVCLLAQRKWFVMIEFPKIRPPRRGKELMAARNAMSHPSK
jgi:hypothetical protein